MVLPAAAGGIKPALGCVGVVRLQGRLEQQAPCQHCVRAAVAAAAAGLVQPEQGQAADLHHAVHVASGTAAGARNDHSRVEQAKTCALRFNGAINLIGGSAALLALVYFQVKQPFYDSRPLHLALLVVVLLTWIITGLLTLSKPLKMWAAPA